MLLGLDKEPQFKRLLILTVHKSLFQQFIATLIKPRVEMIKDFNIPYKTEIDIVIPKGFDSDGGSIPYFGLWCVVAFTYIIGIWEPVSLLILFVGLQLNPFGLMLSSFLVHDFAVRYKKVILTDGTIVHIESISQANKLMLHTNYATNGMKIYSYIAYIGVSLGGWWAWRQHRKNDSLGLNNIKRWQHLLR